MNHNYRTGVRNHSGGIPHDDATSPADRNVVTLGTVCGLCGKHATGLASINDTRYCHGDHDLEPTCYQRATRDQLLRDVAWDAISGGGQNLMERR